MWAKLYEKKAPVRKVHMWHPVRRKQATSNIFGGTEEISKQQNWISISQVLNLQKQVDRLSGVSALWSYKSNNIRSIISQSQNYPAAFARISAQAWTPKFGIGISAVACSVWWCLQQYCCRAVSPFCQWVLADRLVHLIAAGSGSPGYCIVYGFGTRYHDTLCGWWCMWHVLYLQQLWQQPTRVFLV